MAIIEVVKFDGPEGVYAWKYPNQELGTWTQLIVNESQEAILFKGGKALDVFGAGRHTLSTANIPLLQSIVNLPFGGRSPFTAEVWYVNKAYSLDVKWGTAVPIQLQDPKYQLFVNIRSFGQLGIVVEDSKSFLTRLVGTGSTFDRNTLVRYFRGVLMMNIKEMISSYLVQKRISILEISAYLSEISQHIEARIAPTFREFGIRLTHFFIDSINTPEDDPATLKLKEALVKKAEMDILGYTYQQQRTFDTLEGAARNEGSGGANVMGAGIGLGMGVGIGGSFGQQMSGLTGQMNIGASYNKPCPSCNTLNRQDALFCIACGYGYQTGTSSPPAQPTQEAQADQTTCSQCGHDFPLSAKFCPNCGDPNHPCPKCGADNAPETEACTRCGYLLRQPVCGQCGTEVDPSGKFCPECGTSLRRTCPSCQREAKPGQKFCLECGTRLSE
ncbi:SPFH domain-containing protein [Cohnella fermenti]|uniref:SPFH domain-containing protein n=1 Tax=Cohnella fermenti TaxID=2565925 RepID=A0A4S4C8B2_9BACL|nr:SPFH domain-containing protein [Cohnella fermenti]THF84255.1 SPFH domain-containing protein [Cohnella fermenti]